MIVPPGHTEDSVLQIIDRVVRVLAPRFVFGSFEIEDIEQCGRQYALEALAEGSYDPTRPLDKFIYAHVSNRLINLRRDRCSRQPSCRRCYRGDYCTGLDQPCQAHVRWVRINSVKSGLAARAPQPKEDIAAAVDDKTPIAPEDTAEDAARDELVKLVEREIPLDLRADWLRIRAGIRIPRERRLAVESAVLAILGDDLPLAEEGG